MDRTDVPEVDGGSGGDRGDSSAVEGLLERLSEVRMRLEAVAPDDPARWRETIELMRQAQERIGALHHMVAWAREREAALTVRLAGAEMRLAESESRLRELSGIADKVSAAEAGRLAAETDTAQAQQLLTAAQAELEAKHLQLQQLQSRYSDLETDLATMADEVASSTIARAKAERLERQRDVALERARTEARLALEEGVRASDAERQLATLHQRLRATEPQGPWASDETWTSDEASEAASDVAPAIEPSQPEPIDQPVPVTEMVVGDTLDLSEDESIGEDEVIDLTAEAQGSDEDAAAERYVDEAVVWGEPARRGGFVGWLRRGFLGEEDQDQDVEDNDRG